jgi:hypothetical protein
MKEQKTDEDEEVIFRVEDILTRTEWLMRFLIIGAPFYFS